MSELEKSLPYEKYMKYKKIFCQSVKEQLDKSLYPGQENDFFFLTIPRNFPNGGVNVPVDYKLSNLVLYFWKHEFITCGLDQGWEAPHIFKFGFISFEQKKINDIDTFTDLYNLLVEKLGKDNIYIYDIQIIINNSTLSGNEKNNTIVNDRDNYLKHNPNKIMICETDSCVAIYFRSKFIRKIYKKFDIVLPNIDDRLPGGLINTRRHEI